MGALVDKQLKPVHKRTQGLDEPDSVITDAKDFCMTFGEDQQDFENVKNKYDQASAEEKERIHQLLECDEQAFSSIRALASHLSELQEDDFERIVAGLKGLGLDIAAE